MGNYNPNAPIILGEEWVPIREESVIFNEQINSVEMGHNFTLTAPTQLSIGRFYVNKPPSSAINNHAYTMAVYPKGREDKSGPIHSVIIPCNSVGVTGLPPQVGTLDNVTRLANPSSDPDLGIKLQSGSIWTSDVAIFFATNQYATLLSNKRILGVNFLSNFRIPSSGSQVPALPSAFLNGIYLQMRNDSNTINCNFPLYADDFSPARTNNPRVDRIGDVDKFFGSSLPNAVDVMPITYNTFLTKFEATAGAQRINMHFLSRPSAIVGPNVFINYAALEVFYCEETRVAVGTKVYNPWSQTPFLTESPIMQGFPIQTNPIVMRDLAGTANPILPAGEYVVTISQASLGDDFEVTVNSGPHAELNALRELYQIRGLQGRSINIPTPLDLNSTSTVPRTFTAQDTHVLPQISLHVSGGTPFPQVHAYGRQAVGQVYGSLTVTQDILDSAAGGSFTYPWVRFYARRFGETTIPLTLTATAPGAGLRLTGVAGTYASTPDNAALDIVGDIDLRADVTLNSWNTGVGQILLAKYTTAGNQKSYGLGISNLGRVAIFWSSTGANDLESDSTVSPVPAATGRLAIRAILDVNNGAGGNTATFYTAPTLNGPWTQLGAPVVTAGVTSIFSSTAILEVGSLDGGTFTMGPGTVHAVEVVNSVGTAVANPNFAAQSPGTTVFVDGAGRTWTLNGAASIVAGLTTSTVSITPAEWDALPEILDRWKEVTLRFTTAPVMGTLVYNSEWTWSAASEIAGNRWEILGAVAPALSGLPGNLMNLAVPPASQLGSATYGQPSAGTTVNMAWVPWYTPYVSATTEDVTADAVLMFSQDAAPVSGFSISTLSQALTGIGLDCGLNPASIPTAIGYNRLTWTSPSSTGFATELQRMDTVDTTWETIMLSSNTRVTGFNDYEARVDILSSYRIRRVNTYGFYGPWSVTLTATVPAPGVTVGSLGSDGHVMIFTTNSRQNGSSNLAYLPIWAAGTTINEDFAFPEANSVQLQAMYNRDFVTAFRPLERGGERFNRRILVQAAAISPETLADFRSLRDMAWDSVPYICVRDDDGNRWFATVIVPAGSVMRNRRLYEADITIIEVSDTPSQVDP